MWDTLYIVNFYFGNICQRNFHKLYLNEHFLIDAFTLVYKCKPRCMTWFVIDQIKSKNVECIKKFYYTVNDLPIEFHMMNPALVLNFQELFTQTWSRLISSFAMVTWNWLTLESLKPFSRTKPASLQTHRWAPWTTCHLRASESIVGMQTKTPTNLCLR